MIEARGDLWTYPATIRLITTNGTIKTNGEAVMGRGVAAQATGLYPGISRRLGQSLKRWGNIVVLLEPGLGAFPVKYNWWEPADFTLIHSSTQQLLTIARWDPNSMFLLPRPGCGNGGLKWEHVKPFLRCLPDNVRVITNEKE